MPKEIDILKVNREKVDLIIERDAGNPIRILMGKGVENWEALREKCNEAINELE